jgi:hypothetical protein
MSSGKSEVLSFSHNMGSQDSNIFFHEVNLILERPIACRLEGDVANLPQCVTQSRLRPIELPFMDE